MAENQVTDRTLLRFAEGVKTHFAFLEALGFRRVRSEATFVRFESPTIAIDVYHGRQSYEINMEVESMQTSDTYSFGAIFGLLDAERAKKYRNYASHTVEGVAEGVRQLAELFRECVNAGILNNSELFSRLKLQRDEWARHYALEIQLGHARKKSESAWAEKDFEKVVQALLPLQEYLNPSEHKKLEYAKRQTEGSK